MGFLVVVNKNKIGTGHESIAAATRRKKRTFWEIYFLSLAAVEMHLIDDKIRIDL